MGSFIVGAIVTIMATAIVLLVWGSILYGLTILATAAGDIFEVEMNVSGWQGIMIYATVSFLLLLMFIALSVFVGNAIFA